MNIEENCVEKSRLRAEYWKEEDGIEYFGAQYFDGRTFGSRYSGVVQRGFIGILDS